MPDRLAQFRYALAPYRRHGWSLARVLMTPETLAKLPREGGTDADVGVAADVAAAPPTFEAAPVREADVDAMWLSRPSAGGREAWELRLISDPPYALFELFEAEEAEEDREDVRREMEARLAERVAPGGGGGGG